MKIVSVEEFGEKWKIDQRKLKKLSNFYKRASNFYHFNQLELKS